MDEVTLIQLNKIHGEKGSVFHIIKEHDFMIKEVYLSSVKKGVTKGWKKHNQMTLNLVVVKGNVKFSVLCGSGRSIFEIGDDNYSRLVIPPGYWVSFEGLNEENLIINCANLEHDDSEVEIMDGAEFKERYGTLEK